MKTKFLFFFCLLFVIRIGFAQNADVVIDNENILVATSVLDCIDDNKGTAKQYVSISVHNKQNFPVEVSFKREMWYGGKCVSCNSSSDEYTSVIKLEANERLSGACGGSKNLLIFKKMLRLKDVRELSHFELKDLNIRKL